MKRIKKAVCLATAMAIMLPNSAMAAGIRIGGYLDQSDKDVLMLVLNQNSDKDTFEDRDIVHIQQQHVDKNGYFTMELPLDGGDYDFYSNARFRTLSDTREGSIYVSTAGNDNNDGKTPETPLKSLAAAYKQAALLNYEKIIIADDIDYAECPVTYSGTIIIEGATGTEKLNIEVNDDKYINISGDTTFSNLVLSSTGQVNIFAQGNKLKIDENVTTEQRLGVFGGKFRAGMVGDTHLTILGGKHVVICGGGLTGDVNGNTYVTVGGNVNAGDGIDDSDSATISPCYVWGGGSNSSVLGETHVTLKDNAVAKYVCGSGQKTKGKEKKTHINIEGGKVMNVYGGSAKGEAADLESCDTHITMTGGLAEAIFGGSEQNAMTGNTYIYLKGGEVTRRVYTGCYNNYNGAWGSDNYVNGTTNLMIYPDAKVNTKNGLSSSNTSNVGVFSGSRTAAAHDSEKNTIIYMGDSISKFENQIGDKSGWGGTLKSFENYIADIKLGGTVEPVSAGVIKILPDEGNVAYVDNNILETETLNISEGKTVVVEFSKPKETLNISIDYENEELTGFVNGGSYKIDGEDIELTGNKYSISSIISDEDKTLSIVKKGDGTSTSDSDAQMLNIPARPSAPNVMGTAPTENGGKGKITGTTTAMEYRAADGETWIDCLDGETLVSSGSYIVRVKSTVSSFAGTETAAITVPAFSVTPTVKPTATPTAEPTATPTVKPTATPTAEPTATPTVKPTATPTVKPTATPTIKPTATPTVKPTATPTAEPTATPTIEPTATPTVKPTATPTAEPTATPTIEPTATPTVTPSGFVINSLDANSAENDGINVTADIAIKGEIVDGPHTIIAVYDDEGRLIGVQLDYSMEKDVFTFNYRFESGKKYTIKAMIWNDDMVPLAKSYTIYFPKI